MMSGFAMRQAEATFRRALAAYGAACVPVWRVQRDANGVPIGGAQKIGCVYGVRYERGQTANVLVDIPAGILAAEAGQYLAKKWRTGPFFEFLNQRGARRTAGGPA